MCYKRREGKVKKPATHSTSSLKNTTLMKALKQDANLPYRLEHAPLGRP